MNNFRRRNVCCIAILLWLTEIASLAQTVTTFASFNGINGTEPGFGAIVQGTDGNFYGTTRSGGANSSGTVYRITPEGKLTTLYSFLDGDGPTAGLIQASDGNFYGTTNPSSANSSGTVYKITPEGKLTTLYSFCSQPGCSDGSSPSAGLIQASDGNFYGTTQAGGANNEGTIYKITAGGALTTLYSFCSQAGCVDGVTPEAGLIQATDGNFYGTTNAGGAYSGGGTIYKTTPGGTLTTLHSFCSQAGCVDGEDPSIGLIQASDGNFYGTTSAGGTNFFPGGPGTIYKMTPGGTLTTLYSFCSQAGCVDGGDPFAQLIQASDGNFYGTTESGGTNNAGTIYKITSGGKLTTLYSFCSQPGCADGSFPEAGLLQATDGNLYGTTSAGGADNDGTVFKLALASSTTSPAINQSGGVVSGASFQAGIAPNSWITILGTNLSSLTDTWANAIVNGNLPTSLDGVRVSVGGEDAYISYISPTQINALAPDIGTGAVPVTVTNSVGTSPPISATVQTVQPAFFQWGNYAVATRQDFSIAVKNGTFPGLTTVSAKPGDVIILWGTGFGPTSPSAPVGAEVPSGTTYDTANMVTVKVGGVPATVYGAALSPGYAGLYQVAIQIPTSLANGDFPVVATVSGTQSLSAPLITVQN